MVDTQSVDVQPSPKRGHLDDGDGRFCHACGKLAALLVDDSTAFCGVCAYRIRVSDLQRIRLFRLAIG